MLLLSVSLLLAPVFCGGGYDGTKPVPPEKVGGLTRTRLLEGSEAVAATRAAPFVDTAPEESWIASFAGENPVRIFACRYPGQTEAETVLGHTRVFLARNAKETGGSKEAQAAGRSGYKAESAGRSLFFFVHGPWLVWVEGIAADLDPAVRAVQWVKEG